MTSTELDKIKQCIALLQKDGQDSKAKASEILTKMIYADEKTEEGLPF